MEGRISSLFVSEEPLEEIRKRLVVGAVNKSGRHALASALKVAHGEAEGGKLDFYKSEVLAKCARVFLCVCMPACLLLC